MVSSADSIAFRIEDIISCPLDIAKIEDSALTKNQNNRPLQNLIGIIVVL
jgi:hypothetical protein